MILISCILSERVTIPKREIDENSPLCRRTCLSLETKRTRDK